MAGTEPTFDLNSGKPHPYHIVQPSPWPLLGGLAAFCLAMGTVLYMHKATVFGFDIGLKGVYFGALCVFGVMYGWWRDVVREAVVEKAHTPVAQVGFRYGMALFIASEVMFFVAFFWAFFHSSLFPKEAIGFQWPPANVTPIPAFDLPLLMTSILLLSGCTVTWAHHAILENKQADAVRALGLSVLLGSVFMLFQAYEYSHASFPFTSGIYASVFYMITGFHGFHVVVGTIFLAVCYLRARKGHFTPDNHFGFEAAAWYWHFVDLVWLFLFVAIYWWGGA